MSRNRILSDAERGTLLDAIDAATDIRLPTDLAGWSGGALQKILPHKIFACGVGEIRDRRLAFQPMLFGQMPTNEPHNDVVKSSLGVIGQLLSRCVVKKKPQMLSVRAEQAAISRGLGNTAAYGVFDIGGSELSFLTLCGMPVRPDARHAYALQLLAPHLHVVLRRMKATQKTDGSVTLAPQVRLTEREAEVLRWLRQGKSAMEVGQILNRSEYTVKNQMRSIYEKLGARNRAQALHQATKLSIPE